MYLLIQQQKTGREKRNTRFTFHNVSINSYLIDYAQKFVDRFTFHNVSINSRKPTHHR